MSVAIRMKQKESNGKGLHSVLWSPQFDEGDIALMFSASPGHSHPVSSLPADCCPPGGFSLLHRPGQVHFSSVYLPGHHAARRAASRQPTLQDGPH